MERIIIIADTDRDRIMPATFELITAGRMLAGDSPQGLSVLVAGSHTENAARELAERTGIDVLAVENLSLNDYNGETLLAALAGTLRKINPRFTIIAHTSRGSDYAPALAVALSAGCITGVEDLRRESGGAIFTRPLFGGKLMMDVVLDDGSHVITILPGAFKAAERLNSGRGNITTNSSEATPGRIVFRGRSQAAAEDAPITEAEVIVSAGRGIRKKENLELIERLAGLFSRSAVGGSRSVCDLGWLEYSRQVGITGKTVAPKLYIACGISGASQHIAGMKDSQLIIAINSDPGAAIFSIADYGIVEDLTTFIPLVIEESGKPA